MANKKLGKFTIKFNKLAPYKHVKVLMNFEKQADLAMDYILTSIFDEIVTLFKKEKLAKADDKLKGGWTGEVPKIELDVSKSLGGVIERYLKALRWVLMGDLAGKDARKAAEEAGLVKKIIPGLLPSSYLQSLDAQRKHYKDIFGTSPKNVPEDLIKESISKIKTKADRVFEPVLANIKSVILDTVERVMADKANKDTSKVHGLAMDSIHSEGASEALEQANESIDHRIKRSDLAKELESASTSIKGSWSRAFGNEVVGSSSIGAHQAMYEVFGPTDSSVRVVFMTTEDERVCAACNSWSFDDSGNYKYHNIGDFKPSGWNYGKKRSEWKMTVAPSHPRCRCFLLYCPPGFEVNKSGDLVKIK